MILRGLGWWAAGMLALSAAPGSAQTGAAARGAAAAPGGGKVFAHPLSHFLDVFGSICLAHAGHTQQQMAAVRRKSSGFKVVPGQAERFHRQSVSVSFDTRTARVECAVSGLVSDRRDLDGVYRDVAARFALGEPEFGQMGKIVPIEVALWGYGADSPRTIMASASPQALQGEGGSIGPGPAHLVLTLSTPKAKEQ